MLHAKRLIKLKQEEIDEYLKIINQIAIISKTDLEGKITFANEIFCEISGYTQEELIGKSHNIIRDPQMQSKIYFELWKSIQSGNIWKGKIKNKAKNGESYSVQTTILPMFDDMSEAIVGYISVRFLTTEDDTKAKVFKSQVIQQVSEFRNTKLELENKILALENENFKLKNNDFYEKRLGEEIEKNKKLVNQINHYEKEILGVKTNHEEHIVQANKQVFALNKENKDFKHTAKNLKQELTQKEAELSYVKTEFLEAQKEISSLEKRIIELKDIIEHGTKAQITDKS